MSEKTSGPSLSRLTFVGRQFVKIALIGLVVLIVGRFALNAFTALWRFLNPPPPPAPTVGFGALPALDFGEKRLSVPSIKLETISGGLPNDFPASLPVYFFPPKSVSLLDDENTDAVAAALGFVFAPQKLSTGYRYTQQDPLSSVLTINPQTKHFTLTTDYLEQPEFSLSAPSPTTEGAIDSVVQVVSKAGLPIDDLDVENGQAQLLKRSAQSLIPAVSFSEAEFVQVDLRRSPLAETYPVVTNEGYGGTVSALVSGSRTGLSGVIQMRFAHFSLDPTLQETYPLKPVQQAWNELQAGEGYVAQGLDGKPAVVRQVSLGYFDSFTYQTYLQPVYIFSGDDNFLALVSAVDGRWIASPTSQE